MMVKQYRSLRVRVDVAGALENVQSFSQVGTGSPGPI